MQRIMVLCQWGNAGTHTDIYTYIRQQLLFLAAFIVIGVLKESWFY